MVGLVIVRSHTGQNVTTVSFASEVAHHPTTMWVSLDNSSYSSELIHGCGQFTFVVLHVGQAGLAWQCGLTSGRQDDKCRHLDLLPYTDAFWFQSDALTNTACRVRQAVDLGSHTVFVADLVGGEMNTRRLHRRHLLVSDLF
ncbi:MAG: flavin reductase family protein [Vicinamibacterales bacterium]